MRDSVTAEQTAAIGKAVPWLAIGLLIATIGPFSLNSGFIFPANALSLDALGYSAATVGAVGSAGAVGYMVGSLIAPLIANVWGLQRTAMAALLATALIVLGFSFIAPVLAWYPLRVLHGTTTTSIFVCGESALIALAPSALRGRILGFYTAVNSVFFAMGPGVVGLVGFQGYAPYLLVAAFVALLTLPLLILGPKAIDMPAVPVRDMLAAVASIPMLLLVIFAWGWIDGGWLSLLGVYALQRGADASHAAWLLSLSALASVVLQFPIGWLADHMPRRTLLACLSATGLVLVLIMHTLAITGLPLQAVLFLASAVGFGTFTVSLITLGDALSGTALVAANAAYGICWGLGDFAGAFAAGAAMDAIGPFGLPLCMAGGFFVQCLGALLVPLRTAMTPVR